MKWEHKGKSPEQESEDPDSNVCGQSLGKKPMTYSLTSQEKEIVQQRVKRSQQCLIKYSEAGHNWKAYQPWV